MSKQLSLAKVQVPNFILQNPEASVVNTLGFMKKLTVVSLSMITYLRDIFPQEAYIKNNLDGQDVYIMKVTDDVPNTKTVVDSVNNAFELVESRHLKKMILVIQKDITTLETYTFSFSYDDEAIQCFMLKEIDGIPNITKHSQGVPEDIAKSVRLLIRSILVHASTLDPLPDNCGFSLKIVLDEDTPPALFPELLHRSPPEEEENFLPLAENWKLGKVVSKYASFTVSSKSVLNGDDCNNIPANQEQNSTEMDVEDEVPASQAQDSQMTSVLHPFQAILSCHTAKDKAKENDPNSTNLSEVLSVVSLREHSVNCICESRDMSDDTIKCVSCSTLQHKACYKMLDCHTVESHFCVACHDPNKGQVCSVPELISEANRKEMALYRKALIYCFNSSEVSCKRLMTHMKVPRRAAEKILRQLQTDGCLDAVPGNGYAYKSKVDVKDSVFSRYFKAPAIIEDTQQSKRKLNQDLQTLTSDPQVKRPRILTTTTKLKGYLFT